MSLNQGLFFFLRLHHGLLKQIPPLTEIVLIW
jgi:hypothetical protein